MKKLKPLSPTLLSKNVDTKILGFSNTKNVKLVKKFLGQDRALAAIEFGITIKNRGYNLFAMGPTGIGKHSLIHQVLKNKAKKKKTPPDWCYIHNFDNSDNPIALKLPPGKGHTFQLDMKNMVDKLVLNLLTVFESDVYQHGMERIEKYFDKKKKSSESNKEDKSFNLCKKCSAKELALKTKVVTLVAKPLISKLKKKYAKFSKILKYLSEVQNDIINQFEDFLSYDKETGQFSIDFESGALCRYKINLLVDNRNTKGAPVIFADTPTYSNLFSRIEYTTQNGSLTTNFNLIKAGALPRANGGYLIIEARKLMKHTFAWEALKNAIYSKHIKIEPIQSSSSQVKTISLQPMPIPFETKIILMGSRYRYYSLCQHDQDFLKLFKVVVDFDEDIERNNKNIRLYANLLVNMIHEENLLDFDASAIAEIINFSSRLAEDNDKLSMHISEMKDLILESAYWASQANKKIVTKTHVKKIH